MGTGLTHFFSFTHYGKVGKPTTLAGSGAGQDAQRGLNLEHVPTSCAYKNSCGKTCTNNDFKGLPTNP